MKRYSGLLSKMQSPSPFTDGECNNTGGECTNFDGGGSNTDAQDRKTSFIVASI